MTAYALINPDDEIDRIASDIDPETGTKPGWRWLPVEDTRNSYDAALQVESGPVITVLANSVTRVWTVRDKTTEERLAGSSITMRQLRWALRKLGGKPITYVYDTISTIVDAEERDRAIIWYEETDEVHWDDPMTQSLVALTEFSLEQAGAMWLQAPAVELIG